MLCLCSALLIRAHLEHSFVYPTFRKQGKRCRQRLLVGTIRGLPPHGLPGKGRVPAAGHEGTREMFRMQATLGSQDEGMLGS